MGKGVTVDPDKARHAVGKITTAASDASASATHVKVVNNHQVESKWGVEAGPQAFMTTYRTNLTDVQTTLDDLKGKLGQFETAMRNAIQEFVDTDNDSKTKAVIIAGHDKAQQNGGAPGPAGGGKNVVGTSNLGPNAPGGAAQATNASTTTTGGTTPGLGGVAFPTLPSLRKPMAV